jgi:N-acetylglucosaminyl-diphospho-decaprenol L-rhamnosyltransferase
MTSGDYEVVIVTYHSHDELVDLLASARHDQRIVVVDNASGADGTQAVVQGLSAGRWLDGHNGGFAKAANLAARTSHSEYLIFTNPDCRPTPEIWDALVDDLRGDAALRLVGAGAVEDSGRLELGIGGWEPTVLRTFVYASGLHRMFPNYGVFARPWRGERVELDWLGAPCLAIRRDSFLELGGFDERYFVYNEDMALGRAIRAAGFGQRLRTDLDVPHKAASSGSAETSMFQQRGASMAAYLNHHNRRIPASAMRVLLALGAAARAAVAVLSGQRTLGRKHGAYIVGLLLNRPPNWN